MRTKRIELFLTIIALMIFGMSMSSCAYDIYQRKYYPPVYRTYQDNDHGGMDATHGGPRPY
jgi:hypothetical protein